MLRPALRAIALSALLVAVIWAVPSFAISKEFNQSYALQAGGFLELQNVKQLRTACRGANGPHKRLPPDSDASPRGS